VDLIAFLPPRIERFVNKFPEEGRPIPFAGLFHDLIDRVDLINLVTEAINFGFRHHSSFAHAVLTSNDHSKRDRFF
jgi:hypothetical protein